MVCSEQSLPSRRERQSSVTWQHKLEVAPSETLADDGKGLRYTNWPASTESLCHHCCHTFETIPVPLPQTYDRVKRIYHCRGIFCSWQCAKAHNLANMSLIGRGDRNTYISLLAFKMWVKHKVNGDISKGDYSVLDKYSRYHITASPPKECLKAFGGTVNIEDYRSGFFGILPPAQQVQGKPSLNIRETIIRESTTLPFVNLSLFSKPADARVARIVSDKPINTHRTPFMVPSGSPKATTLHKSANAFCSRLNRAKDEKADKSTMLKRKRHQGTKNPLMASMGIVVEKRNK